MTCTEEGCTNDTYKAFAHCAMHLDMVSEYSLLSKEEQVEAIGVAALQSSDMEVSADGDIRLKEDEA